ncbi:DedA family protein [Candidatus Woesearchaeota archaeon]|nr:DedA family protein [Candidatus Woesearchaeota archaeon]
MIELLGLATGIITNFISSIGYLGIFILMALESTATPVPSELVMPFAGFLAHQGRFSLPMVILVGSLGCLMGSLISYFVGRHVGLPFVKKYGKYVFISESELNWTVRWFNKKGDKTIFISRFIPVIRHIISIPAGIGRMNIWKFSAYTYLGSLIWVSFLAYLGFTLRDHWEDIRKVTEKISIFILAILAMAIIIFAWKHIKEMKKKK